MVEGNSSLERERVSDQPISVLRVEVKKKKKKKKRTVPDSESLHSM